METATAGMLILLALIVGIGIGSSGTLLFRRDKKAGTPKPSPSSATPARMRPARRVVKAAAPPVASQPQRSDPGSVLVQAKRLGDDRAQAGVWLYASNRSVSSLDDDPTGHYLRVTQDPEMPGGYLIERLTAADFIGRQSGSLDVHVFFVSAEGHVSQGTSQVKIGPVGPDLERPVPSPSEAANRPIARYPIISDAGMNDLARLAGQLSRARYLEDDDLE